MTIPSLEIAALKQAIRQEAFSERKRVADKDEKSQQILASLLLVPAFQKARTILFYLDVRSEVRTRKVVASMLDGEKTIIVPYCLDGRLELFHLESMEELAQGAYGILEPKSELRNLSVKKVPLDQIDLIVVPGVAFDRRGNRLGHGNGYYDKLLRNTTSRTLIIALAYECQLFSEIPRQSHDIFMHMIISEEATYPCNSL